MNGCGRRFLILRSIVAVLLAAGMLSVIRFESTGVVFGADAPNAIAGHYVVRLRDTALRDRSVDALVGVLGHRYGGKIQHVYTHAVRGFSVVTSPASARRLASDPAVLSVEQDRIAPLDGAQSGPNPPWGL